MDTNVAPRSGDGAARACHALGDNPPGIRDGYRRLALVSHPRHMRELDAADEDTLVVAHSWLLWQEAIAGGWHCVQYESEAARQEHADQATDIHVRTNDWLYAGGDEDPTIFHGVSLGRRFSREIGLLIMERERLERALECLVARYRPSELLFMDFRADYAVMDCSGRFALVKDFADRHGIAVLDQRDPPTGDDPHLPFAEFYGRDVQEESAREAIAVTWARRGLVTLLDILGGLRRRLSPGRPVVIMANTHLTAIPLIENFRAGKLFALILADWYPRKRDVVFLVRNLARGALPASCRRPRLDDDDAREIVRIEDRLEEAWRTPPHGHEREIRRYVKERIIAPGRLRAMAADVKWVERMLKKHHPDMVLSDGLDYHLCHIFFILAKDLGIATAATWHAPYIQDVRMGILGGDPRVVPAIDLFLTWGPINEAWLDAIGATARAIRTGSPTIQRSPLAPAPSAKRDRALLLQYLATGEDHAFPQAAQYPFFVETVRMLRRIGFSEVRLKVHPGAYSKEHYRMVAEAFGLDCAIYKDESFQDLVVWADIVIGPVVSGAMVEVLGTGKPYYPILLRPHAVNTRYLKGHPVFSSVEELGDALLGDEAPDFGKLIDDLAGIGHFPNPARRAWEVLSDELSVGCQAPAARPEGSSG